MRGIRSRLAERSGRHGRDGGLSLVELMVTMLITGLVAALTASLVIGVQKTNQANVVRQDQVDAARVAVEGMSKTLRASVKPSQVSGSCTTCASDAFLVGGNLTVQFYANINNPKNSVGPSRVTYTVASTGSAAGQLVETIQRPTSNIPTASGYTYCAPGAAGCASTIKTRVLARGVVTTSPVFSYFDQAGVKMTPGSGSLSAAQLKNVLSMEVVVQVQMGTRGEAKPTTYIQRVMLPNAQAVMKAGTT